MKKQGRRAWCTWTNEPCDPKLCNYAICYKRQMLDGGICGFSIKRRTREDTRPEDLFRDEIKIGGKLMRRIGEKRIF
ncbi:MAG: hypothetical protein ACE5OO_08250 [Candidatus Bathyarchaeia archaeon]